MCIVVEAPPGTVPMVPAGASVQAPVCAAMPTMMSSAGVVMPVSGSSMGFTGTTLSTGLPYPSYPSVYRPTTGLGMSFNLSAHGIYLEFQFVRLISFVPFYLSRS